MSEAKIFYEKTDAISLNALELFYLRLFMHNYTDDMIAQFLELELKQVSRIKKSISLQFKEHNWCNIIVKAFDLGLLKKSDYIDNQIKPLALKFCSKLIDGYNQVYEQQPLFLQKTTMAFYLECKNKLSQNAKISKAHYTFSQKEITYINLKFNDFDEKYLAAIFNYNKSQATSIANQVFRKLGTTNWYNIFRMAHMLNILEIHEMPQKELKAHINNCCKKIRRIIKLSNSITINEKKLAIYTELLQLFNAVEYAHIFKLQFNRDTFIYNQHQQSA